MTKDVVKQGYELAEKELKDKQVEEVKQIVLRTLEKIKAQEKIRDEAVDKIKLLKMDIDDLKDGKLDRIVERQDKDPEAKKTSVVIIIKETKVETINPWYIPYKVIWNDTYSYYPLPATCATTSGTSYTAANSGVNSISNDVIDITCSVAKDATIGTYQLMDSIVHLR